MDKLKKARKAIRIAFDKLYEELNSQLSVTGSEYAEIMTNFEMISKTYESIKEIDDEIFREMLGSECSDEDINAEVESKQDFLRKYTKTKVAFENLIVKTEVDAVSICSNQSNNNRRKFTLPKIEFKKFSGDIKEWLPFWSQFCKIDQDEEIVEEDKFQYLLQAIPPNTRARELVESYPPTAKNYSKVIESLKARFGRDDLLVEVYVRELLRLVLRNVIKSENMMLCTLYDKLETQLRSLESLGVTSDTCAAMLFPLVESALPEELLRAWQRSTSYSSGTDTTMKSRLNELMKFLKNEVEGEERISLAVAGFGLETEGGKTRKKKMIRPEENIPTATGLLTFKKDQTFKCIFCAGSHTNDNCFKAQKLDLKEKKKKLLAGKCCFECLKWGHTSKKCPTNLKCVICSGRHVPLMCRQLDVNKDPSSSSQDHTTETTTKVENALANHTCRRVLLQTLLVIVKGEKSERRIRILIDTGSQKSYIRKKTANEMGYAALGMEEISHALFGGAQTSARQHSSHRVRLTSLDGKYACSFEVLDQPLICSNIASARDGPWMEELQQLKISLSDYEQTGPIEVLVGADVAGKLLTGRRQLLACGLVAVETLLGWTLMGKVPDESRCDHAMVATTLFAKAMNIEDLWSLDVLGIEDPGRKKSRSEMEQAAMEHFLQTVTVNSEGRYEVAMPWIEGHAPIPNNYNLAKKRLESLLKKLKSDKLYEDYQAVMNEWLEEGVIEEVHGNEPVEKSHYLPHRCVVKESSTTKLRPVFDASAREKHQPSLNQCLEKGINTIELIPNLLTQFRLRRIGVVADIRRAFLQISLNVRDRDFLRFLWVDATGAMHVYRHARVAFGVSCSPFLLGAVIQHHLNQILININNEKSFYSPDVIRQLMGSFYVDNCVTSVNDECQLRNFVEETTQVMREGRFELRGWEYSLQGETLDGNSLSPVLGVMWNRNDDSLHLNTDSFKNILEENEPITKRKILSIIHRIFDPVGFSCPAFVVPKMLLQQTWQTKVGWDAEVDENIQKNFSQWLEEIHYLSSIKIPRWIAVESGNECNWSLHTFCDASQTAFATAVFLRSESNNVVNVQLVLAKSRVVPVKKTTIPRLELLAATIGARLSMLVIEALNITDIQKYWWTDSTTVLSWIQQEDQWTPFVWNRVQEIRDLTTKDSWRHVPGSLNPADLPSRGCSPKQLLASRWWEGPEWLRGSHDSWPTNKYTCNQEEIGLERKKGIVSSVLLTKSSEPNRWYCSYFSTYQKTVNLIGWVYRFIKNCRLKQERAKGELSVEELCHAEEKLMKFIQQECFTDVEDKRLKSLCPFKDDVGVIRIRTKISKREDHLDFRFPIVLPAGHPVVNMLIREKHERSCHVGVQGLLSLLREHFWIIGGRRTIRAVLVKCVTCRRQESRRIEVEPAPLPTTRVRDAAVFEITGVDLAGPLYLKGNQKAWICLYTCAVYRAVHLELVTTLSTDGFLQAFRRFIARRGRPAVVYSDNGTNFVGAENAFEKLDWNQISRYSTVERIKWIFNPPTAAWWGGWWERMVRIIKQLLRKVLGRASLTYEELATILCDCEAIINSRPLTYVSDDVTDLTPLTPAMFLQEVKEVGVPDCDLVDAVSLNRRSRYRMKLKEDLRRRFRNEYLGKLVHHCRDEERRKVQLGEIVLVGYENKKRLDWPLAKVEELIPGRDGNVRLVRLKTSAGELLRPLQRLYPLEVVSRNNQGSQDLTERSVDIQERSSDGDSRSTDATEEIQKTIRTRVGRVVKTPKKLNL